MSDKIDLQKKKEENEKIERDNLLDRIRRAVARDPSLKLNTEDLLPKEIFELSTEELRIVTQNIELVKLRESSLLNAKGVVSSLNILTELVSSGLVSIKKAENDVELAKDIEELMSQYFGDVPVVSRIVMRLLSYVEYNVDKTDDSNTRHTEK